MYIINFNVHTDNHLFLVLYYCGFSVRPPTSVPPTQKVVSSVTEGPLSKFTQGLEMVQTNRFHTALVSSDDHVCLRDLRFIFIFSVCQIVPEVGDLKVTYYLVLFTDNSQVFCIAQYTDFTDSLLTARSSSLRRQVKRTGEKTLCNILLKYMKQQDQDESKIQNVKAPPHTHTPPWQDHTQTEINGVSLLYFCVSVIVLCLFAVLLCLFTTLLCLFVTHL